MCIRMLRYANKEMREWSDMKPAAQTEITFIDINAFTGCFFLAFSSVLEESGGRVGAGGWGGGGVVIREWKRKKGKKPFQFRSCPFG